jgi:hypothetical protein
MVAEVIMARLSVSDQASYAITNGTGTARSITGRASGRVCRCVDIHGAAHRACSQVDVVRLHCVKP